jgi:Rps23 Pro-64 3,4-dihydroxylase Tpa1-like proline 4-hydroxylase
MHSVLYVLGEKLYNLCNLYAARVPQGYQLKTGHCLTGQCLKWTGNQPTAGLLVFFVYSYSHLAYPVSRLWRRTFSSAVRRCRVLVVIIVARSFSALSVRRTAARVERVALSGKRTLEELRQGAQLG